MEATRVYYATTTWNELCIYRVPYHLQENDEKSYFPQTVSIGPYHHGHKHLMPMERHKWRAVNKVMEWTTHSIEMYIDAMEKLEKKARACYEGPIDMTSNKFTEMLVLDGCFVLELFRGTINGFSEIGYAPHDPVFGMQRLMHLIQRDMVMLENQLPLFVLDRLLELQLGIPNQTGIVAKAAVKFFEPLMPTGEEVTTPDQSEVMRGREEVVKSYTSGRQTRQRQLANNEQLHCLDVFHRSLFQTFDSTWTPYENIGRLSLRNYMSFVMNRRQQQLIHCVTELREAGVKFRRKKTDQLWDITFSKGYLEIPKLLIHDGTKSLFSNLMAYEQCHIHSNNRITSYMIFMDNLINSSNDVSYLHRCGIIEHWLGSDSEVADLFNGLCKEVVFNPKNSYLWVLSKQVNNYYSRPWNSLKATLRHKYFNNPWAYFSFLAAVALLILTFLQTFYATLGYYKQSS